MVVIVVDTGETKKKTLNERIGAGNRVARYRCSAGGKVKTK